MCGVLWVDTHPVTTSDPLDEELSHRRTAAGENRIPPAVAVVVAAVVYALLPQSLLLGPRFAIPIIELALLAALIATNPRRMVRQSRWSRIAATALAGLVIVANLTALGMLIARLVASSTSGGSLLLGAMQVWITNVIGFALLYWELDRGGPSRTGAQPTSVVPDFLFPQMTDNRYATPDWMPRFGDYLYVSLTNQTAFSPTDTAPLTRRVKALMGIQGTSALITTGVIVARAVNLLG